MKEAILFDLDGTLWNVKDTTYESVNIITKKHNLDEVSKDTIHRVFGLNRVESAKLYFPNLDMEYALELMEEISRVNISNLSKKGGYLYSNLEKVVEELSRNFDLYIVSNTGHKEYIEAFLTTSNLEKFFKGYYAASELKLSKGETIQKVLNDCNIDKAVYVGDTIKDLEASTFANIPFIQAKYGFGEDLNTDYYINELDDLPKLVTKLF